MVDRVFYSWQSDLPGTTNRHLIEKALEQAITQLRSDGAVGVELAPDRDTAGVPGTPDIAATIFEKIAKAAVFVADVSIVRPGGDGKRPTPNPNVLVELGYAVGTRSWPRIVLVLNTAFGRAEDLPFDLRHRQVLMYDCAQVRRDKSTSRKRLSRDLKEALEAILVEPPPAEARPRKGPSIARPARLLPRPEDLAHVYYRWDVMVREARADAPDGWMRAQRHCTVRVLSRSLRRNSFTGTDETSFLELVRRSFPDDAKAHPDESHPSGVTIRHADEKLRFDRVWTWGSVDAVGVLGMAVTLPIVGFPEVYSLADTVQDVARFLRMAGDRLGPQLAVVWLELAAFEMVFTWSGSEAAMTSRLGGPTAESRRGTNEDAFVQKKYDSGHLVGADVASATAELLRLALTLVHKQHVDDARIASLAAEVLPGRESTTTEPSER